MDRARCVRTAGRRGVTRSNCRNAANPEADFINLVLDSLFLGLVSHSESPTFAAVNKTRNHLPLHFSPSPRLLPVAE